MRRSDARSAQIGSPAGISQVFQVKANSCEPLAPIRARNLLSKNDWRSALGDEVVKSGPKMSFVGVALALSRARKRLTRAGAGPDGAFVGPACPPKSKRPTADAGEEVDLGEVLEFLGADVGDGSVVHDSRRNVSPGDEFSEPRAGFWVDVVVVGMAHLIPL
jgi:hypothetical protein